MKNINSNQSISNPYRNSKRIFNEKNIVILVHSGVSEKKRNASLDDPAMKTTILAAFEGFNELLYGKSAVDAVEKSINIMESSGLLNAGSGSVSQKDGIQRMDASIMDSNLECGSIASLRGFENPITIARWIKEHSSDNGATFYAFDKITERLLAEEEKIGKEIWKKIDNYNNLSSKSIGHDTVGSVAIDIDELLCAGTSTGGRRNATPGRIGDSPIIGSGTYCNSYAAVSNTGYGEEIVKLCIAKRIVDLVQFEKLSPTLATKKAGDEFYSIFKHTLGSICVDKDGNWGINIVGKSMFVSIISCPYSLIADSLKKKRFPNNPKIKLNPKQIDRISIRYGDSPYNLKRISWEDVILLKNA